MVKRKKRRAARRPTNPTPVVAGAVTPMRLVPSGISRPEYADRGYPTAPPPADLRKTDDVIDRMRRAGSAARRVLKAVAAEIAPGVTTEHLDEVTHETSIAEGGYPSPLNYNGFPKSLCTSINEVICHGIPDDRPLAEGDIVNCDVTIFLEGVHGDLSETFLVGEVEHTSRRLVEVTRQSMYAGIGAVRAGGRINEIGQAIQTVAEGAGFGVVREFIGHGVGEIFHHQPNVPHYYDPAARFEIQPGMTFTIEPMITVGAWRAQLWNDGWTATTVDLSRCAQFEHTLLVLEDGVELLTVEDHEPQPFMVGADESQWPEQLPTAAMLADRTR